MVRRVVLQDHLAKLADRYIEIEAGGEQFKILPPELWPDTITRTSDDREDVITLIGGQESYDRFVAAGGSWRVLQSIINDGFEADIPES